MATNHNKITNNFDSLFVEAVAFHNAGNTLAALPLYLDLISKQPSNGKILFLLGSLYGQIGDLKNCIRSLNLHLNISPQNEDAYNNLAIAYELSQQQELAIATYKKALSLSPLSIHAHCNLGDLYRKTGKFEKSLAHLNEALKHAPQHENTLLNKAILLGEMKQADEAKALYCHAINLYPNNASLLNNYAGLLQLEENLALAEKWFRKALIITPNYTQALSNLGNLLVTKKKYKESKTYLLQAIKIDPNFVQAYINMGFLYHRSALFNDTDTSLLQLEKDLEQAEAWTKKALSITPNSPQALSNLGSLLETKKRYKESEACLLQAIKIDPNFVQAYINMGFLYHQCARFNEANIYFDKAIEINPDSNTGHWYRSFTLLLTGEFNRAWDDYEYGLKNGERNTDHYQYPYQHYNRCQQHEQNSTVLVTAEQGIGDQIMFSSCLPDFIKQHDIIIECDKRLVPLFKRTYPSINVIHTEQYNYDELKSLFPLIQQQISIGSLPQIFRRQSNAFPTSIHKLRVDKKKQEKWQQRYSLLGNKLKIGISWRGGTKIDNKNRSMQLASWSNILKNDCHFINLQYGEHSQEINDLKKSHGITIHDWDDSDSLKEIDDFSAQVSALDLVISVGNTNVHLAGSLNIPTWCLIPFVPSWRWLFNGSRCLWYPSVNMYRQHSLNSWEPTLLKIEQDLLKLTSPQLAKR